MVHAASLNRSTCFLFVNQVFLQELVKVSIQQNFLAMSYGKGVIKGIGGDTKRVVAQVVGSCDGALEISFLWKAELYQCAYIFPANVDKSWIESSEVVRVHTQSTWDNCNHYRFDVVI